jgi:hypothetical protein
MRDQLKAANQANDCEGCSTDQQPEPLTANAIGI